MKYVVLIHANPQPWNHPTGDTTAALQALEPAERERLDREFEELLGELSASGELIGGTALGDPNSAKIYRWQDGAVATDGPYSEIKEHLAGFFDLDVASRERAEEIAAQFASPGDTIELRPQHGAE